MKFGFCGRVLELTVLGNAGIWFEDGPLNHFRNLSLVASFKLWIQVHLPSFYSKTLPNCHQIKENCNYSNLLLSLQTKFSNFPISQEIWAKRHHQTANWIRFPNIIYSHQKSIQRLIGSERMALYLNFPSIIMPYSTRKSVSIP